jgi:hypothetical protein
MVKVKLKPLKAFLIVLNERLQTIYNGNGQKGLLIYPACVVEKGG